MPEQLADRPNIGTITAIETATVSLQASSALAVHGARGKHTSSDFVMIRLHTSEGAIGYGEVSATPRWSGEDAESLGLLICNPELTLV